MKIPVACSIIFKNYHRLKIKVREIKNFVSRIYEFNGLHRFKCLIKLKAFKIQESTNPRRLC